MSRTDRGLLTNSPQKNPGPHEYDKPELKVIKKNNGHFKMSKATRDIPFAKYSSTHSELVRKGIN